MSVRIFVQSVDYGTAANVGGPVHATIKSFEVDAPELEAHLREYESDKKRYQSVLYTRAVIGAELEGKAE